MIWSIFLFAVWTVPSVLFFWILLHDYSIGKPLIDYGIFFYILSVVTFLGLIASVYSLYVKNGRTTASRQLFVISIVSAIVVMAVCFYTPLVVDKWNARFRLSPIENALIAASIVVFSGTLLVQLMSYFLKIETQHRRNFWTLTVSVFGEMISTFLAVMKNPDTRKVAVGATVNFSVTIASLLVGFVIAEVGARIYAGKSFTLENYIFQRSDLLTRRADPNHLPISVYDPVLGWALRPMMDVRVMYPGSDPHTREFTSTSEYGFRMNSSTLKPLPKGAIMAVGDSFTAGSEVGDFESWPAYLESILGKNVLNGAAGGWGVDQMVLRAEQMIPIIEPEVVIVSVMVDDILRNEFRTYGGGNKPYFMIEDGRLVHHNNPVPRLEATPKDIGVLQAYMGYSYLIDQIMLEFMPYRWTGGQSIYNHVDNDPVEVSCLLMKRLQRKANEENIRLIFMMQYGMSHVSTWDEVAVYGKRLLSCVNDYGIESLDLWPEYQRLLEKYGRKYTEKFAVMHGDQHGHHSALGNRHVAEMLAKTFWPNEYAEADGLYGDDWLSK